MIKGLKKDVTTKRDYCSRKDPLRTCWRTNFEDFYNEKDILCDDTADKQCNKVILNTDPLMTNCFLYYPVDDGEPISSASNNICDNDKLDDIKWIIPDPVISNNSNNNNEEGFTLYYRIPCDEFNGDCLEFKEEDCQLLAQQYHEKCSNSKSNNKQQIITWYQDTGNMFVYPNWNEPYRTTLIRGLTDFASYTVKPDRIIIDLMPLRTTGVWQSFQGITNRDGYIRQLDVWYQNSNESTLTATLYDGEGITDTVFLTICNNKIIINATLAFEMHENYSDYHHNVTNNILDIIDLYI